jgi:hypothetical protein
MRWLWRRLAGEDGPARTALPLGEMLHPAPLAAVLLLVVNDHLLKGSGLLPSWLTGKISDFAGALFFPLLLTSCGDVIAFAIARVTGARLDFSLRRWKIGAAIVATATIMICIELVPAATGAYVRFLRAIGFASAQSTADPTDLAALIMLAPAWLVARAELARVPLGRLEVIRRARGDAAAARRALADVRALRASRGVADATAVDELADAIGRGDDEAAAAALRRLRDPG